MYFPIHGISHCNSLQSANKRIKTSHLSAGLKISRWSGASRKMLTALKRNVFWLETIERFVRGAMCLVLNYFDHLFILINADKISHHVVLVRLFQLLTTPSNIFNSFPDSAKIAKSSVILTVDLYDKGGNRLAISDTREQVEIVLSRPDSVQPAALAQHAVMSSQDERVDMFYYQVNVSVNDSSLHIELAELDPAVQLLVLVRFDQFPQLNTTEQGTRGWDFMQLLPASMTDIG